MLNLHGLSKRLLTITFSIVISASIINVQAASDASAKDSIIKSSRLFLDCNSITNNDKYRLLQKYFSTSDIHDGVLCLKLNDDQFIYIERDNVYYCKSDKGSDLSCQPSEKGAVFPNIHIALQFSNNKGKRFILFVAEELYYNANEMTMEGPSVYSVFFLVPKPINPRGYILYTFPDAGADDPSEACAASSRSETTSTSTPEVDNEDQTSVLVRFKQQVVNCRTNEMTLRTLEYTWQNRTLRFKETKK